MTSPEYEINFYVTGMNVHFENVIDIKKKKTL